MISVQELRDLNKLLIIVDDLRAVIGRPFGSSVLLACQQTTFWGGLEDHAASIDAALRLGLLVLWPDSSLQITDTGSHLLSLNPKRCYEMQPAQSSLLFEILVEEGPLKKDARAVALLAERDRASSGLKIRAAKVKEIPRNLSTCFSVLLFLGVFEPEGDQWRVRPDYMRQIGRMRKQYVVGEEELNSILLEQASLGRAAEVITVEYERQRLRFLGADPQALLVNRVSETDVGAGYDVESFAGPSSTLEPDRFIEVKASGSKNLRFFWTRNEYEVARTLGPAYFIYFVGGFRPEQGVSGFSPRIIQNPVATLASLPRVRIEPQVYLVTEDVSAAGRMDMQAVALRSVT